MKFLQRYFPILTWGREYDRQTLGNDLVVAVIVTLMLIPQSLAYALVAGLPPFDPALWVKILVPALLISIVGYVESISVALTLAAKKRQRVDPDQELIALGSANFGSALSSSSAGTECARCYASKIPDHDV